MYVAGVLCDFFKYAPQFMSKYLNETMGVCKLFMQSNDCVKRNTAFLIGLICDACKDHAHMFYTQAGQLLEPLIISTKPEVKDNALAALARMVISNEEQTPNSEQVISLVCSFAPFVGDKQENSTLIKMFLYLGKKYAQFLTTKIDLI